MSADYDPHASSLDGTADPAVLAELFAIRKSIDNIDASLIHVLAERFKFTQRVGELKASHGLPPSDPGREAAQIARLKRLAHEADLEPEFAQKFLTFVIAEVIRHHRAIAAGEQPIAAGEQPGAAGEQPGEPDGGAPRG